MLELFIKLTEKLLNYLNKKKEVSEHNLLKVSEKKSKYQIIFEFLFFIAIQAILICYIILTDASVYILLWSLFLCIFFLLYHKIFTKKITIDHIFQILIPINLSVIAVCFEDFWLNTWMIFLWIFPIIFMIRNIFCIKNKLIEWVLKKVEAVFYYYNLSVFFAYSLLILASIIWNTNFSFTWLLFQNYWSYHLLEILFSIIIAIILLWGTIKLLDSYLNFKALEKLTLVKSIGVFLWFILILNIPWYLMWFHEYNAKVAKEVIYENGINQKSLEKADRLFLKSSILALHKNGDSRYDDTFEIIYDTTVTEYFADKLPQNKNRRNRATSLSQVGENAKVEIKNIEFQNKVKTADMLNYMESQVTLHFQNTSKIEQEVVMHFSLPSKYSVISDLKLGLNGELIGQIAPRGAANKVYTQSLIRNIDPALLEKVWATTYSLRVFPILSKTNQRTNWAQKVEFTFFTPLEKYQNEIITTPKFSFINGKIENESSYIEKNYLKDKIVSEKVLYGKNAEKALEKSHSYTFNNIITDSINISDICYHNELSQYLNSTTIEDKKLDNKIIVFIDNSKSTDTRFYKNTIEKIVWTIKNYNNELQDLDLYSFNSSVEKIADTSQLEMWGYSSMNLLIENINLRKIENKKIIIITDDHNYLKHQTNNNNLQLNGLVSNQLNIIQIGDKIRKYPSDMNNIISATSGNIYEISNSDQVDLAIAKVMNDEKQPDSCITTSENEDIHRMLAGRFSRDLLKPVINSYTLNLAAEKQTAIAKKYHIVNEYNSIIALETKQQQRDLDRFSQQNNKYETQYNNFSEVKVWISSFNNRVSAGALFNTIMTDDISIRSSGNGMTFGADKVNIHGGGERYSTDFSFFWLIIFLIKATYILWFINIMWRIIKAPFRIKNEK